MYSELHWLEKFSMWVDRQFPSVTIAPLKAVAGFVNSHYGVNFPWAAYGLAALLIADITLLQWLIRRRRARFAQQASRP